MDRSKTTLWQELAALRRDISTLTGLVSRNTGTLQEVISRVAKLETLVSNCNEDVAGVCDRLDRLEAHVGIACTCGTGPVKPSLEQHFDSCPWIEF